MRSLVFGDVHGNLPALEAMLAAEQGNYDVLISHGDVVNYGPWSNECVELLQSLQCICLTGNHETAFLQHTYPGQNIIAKTFFEFCYPLFQKHQIIADYQAHYTITDFEIVHTLNNQYIYPDSDVSFLTINRNYIFGHSHYQFHRQWNGYQLYNTGSVGQNRGSINIINYLIVDEPRGNVMLKALPYDVEIVINEMKNCRYPKICIDYYAHKNRA